MPARRWRGFKMSAPDDDDVGRSLGSAGDDAAIQEMLLLHVDSIRGARVNWVEGGFLMVALYAVALAERVAENLHQLLLKVGDAAFRGNLRDFDIPARRISLQRRLRMALRAARLLLEPEGDGECALPRAVRRTLAAQDYYRALCAESPEVLWPYQAFLLFPGLERHAARHVHEAPEPSAMCCAWF